MISSRCLTDTSALYWPLPIADGLTLCSPLTSFLARWSIELSGLARLPLGICALSFSDGYLARCYSAQP